MTNEDKVKQQIARNIAYNLGNKVCDDIKTYGYEDVYNAALQALQREEQQLIDKAAEWLRMTMDFFNNGEFNTEKFVNDFKKEMKGE